MSVKLITRLTCVIGRLLEVQDPHELETHHLHSEYPLYLITQQIDNLFSVKACTFNYV